MDLIWLVYLVLLISLSRDVVFIVEIMILFFGVKLRLSHYYYSIRLFLFCLLFIGYVIISHLHIYNEL